MNISKRSRQRRLLLNMYAFEMSLVLVFVTIFYFLCGVGGVRLACCNLVCTRGGGSCPWSGSSSAWANVVTCAVQTQLFFFLLFFFARPEPAFSVVLSRGAARASTRAYCRTSAGPVTRKTIDHEAVRTLELFCVFLSFNSHDARNVTTIHVVRVSVFAACRSLIRAGPRGFLGVARSCALPLNIICCCLFWFSLFFAPLVVRAGCLARRNFTTSLGAPRLWLTRKRSSR